METADPSKDFLRVTGELERRRASRYEPDAEIACTIRDPRSNEQHTAAIRDVSASGIALLTDAPFEVGSLLTIELCHADRGLKRKFLVEVRHADICYPNDSWLHGCRFVKPLTDEELQSWL